MFDSSKIIDVFGYKYTKEGLLAKISNEEILKFYLPNESNSYKICCPLHNEKTPSFVVTNGKFKCFGCGAGGSGIDFIMFKYNLTLPEAIRVISGDLGLCIYSIDRKAVEIIGLPYIQKITNIKIKSRKFEVRDKTYWASYGISLQTCVKHHVFPISHYWINDYIFTVKPNDLCYAYNEHGKFKIYFPNKPKNEKWYGNTHYNTVFGLDLLPKTGNLLIWTSSKKDLMLLDELGYNSIAASSETAKIPLDVLNDLKARFKTIILFLNNDDTGLKIGHQFSKEFDIPFEYIPLEYMENDPTDFFKSHGLDKTSEMVYNLISKYERIN